MYNRETRMVSLSTQQNTPFSLAGHLSQLFPPPAFLTLPAAGLHIGDSFARVIAFKGNRKPFRLSVAAARSIPAGTLSGGVISNKSALVSVLTSLRKELHLHFVRVALPEEKTFLFPMPIPDVPAKELRSALELQLEEHIPLSGAEAVFDYVVAPDKNHPHLVVSAVPANIVEDYFDACRLSGLTPLSFEIETQALSRSIIRKGDADTYLIVRIGGKRTVCSVVSGGIVRFTSSIPIGGEAILDAIAKHYGVSKTEAEAIRMEKAFVFDKRNMEFFFSLLNALSALKDEVNRVVSYWQNLKEGGGAIKSVILAGEDGAIVGLDEYLLQTTGQKVHVGSVWENAFSLNEYVPPIPFIPSFEYGAAIGLALPHLH